MMKMARELDPLDEKIISMLECDGRRSSSDISRQLGIPRSTIHRRIESLVDDGVIVIRAFADSRTIGLPTHVWFELRVALEEIARVAHEMARFKELRWVGIISGSSNILAEGFFTSTPHLHAFVTHRLAHLSGIQQLDTHHVLSLEKFAFDWSSMLHAVEDYEEAIVDHPATADR